MLTRVAKTGVRLTRSMSSLVDKFATVDPRTMSGDKPGRLWNLVGGEWRSTVKEEWLKDPMNGEAFCSLPSTGEAGELEPFVKSMGECPKSGLHNPLKNPQRYLLYGEVMRKTA